MDSVKEVNRKVIPGFLVSSCKAERSAPKCIGVCGGTRIAYLICLKVEHQDSSSQVNLSRRTSEVSDARHLLAEVRALSAGQEVTDGQGTSTLTSQDRASGSAMFWEGQTARACKI